MTSAAPTVVALETNSAWILILATSLVTLPLVLLLRRLINRPGGLASGVLIGLPLFLPLIVAIVFHGALLPEVAVLRPAVPSLLDSAGKELFDLFWFASDKSGVVVPYALWGSPGPWLVLFGVAVSSFMLLRRAAGALVLHRLLRRSVPLEQTRWATLDPVADRLLSSSRLRRRPSFLVLPSGVSGTFVTAGGGGRILISREFLDSLSDDEMEGVLAHEIAHLEARDIPVVITAGLLRDLVAWNPLAHVALRRLLRDREFEADRRAAAITGKPLAVASSLLKVYELSRGHRTITPRAALPFVRNTARVSRRVSRLVALADRQIPVRGTNYVAFMAAACLVAVLALQVGMRIGGQDESAFAIVLGAPEISEADVWSRARQRPAGEKTKSDVPAANVEKSKIMRPRTDLLRGHLGVQTKDLARWRHSMTSLAVRRGIAPATVHAELRDGWHAVPLFLSPTGGSVALYRIEHALPKQLFGGLWGKTQNLRRSD